MPEDVESILIENPKFGQYGQISAARYFALLMEEATEDALISLREKGLTMTQVAAIYADWVQKKAADS